MAFTPPDCRVSRSDVIGPKRSDKAMTDLLNMPTLRTERGYATEGDILGVTADGPCRGPRAADQT
jgi:hypothetical protein